MAPRRKQLYLPDSNILLTRFFFSEWRRGNLGLSCPWTKQTSIPQPRAPREKRARRIARANGLRAALQLCAGQATRIERYLEGKGGRLHLGSSERGTVVRCACARRCRFTVENGDAVAAFTLCARMRQPRSCWRRASQRNLSCNAGSLRR